MNLLHKINNEKKYFIFCILLFYESFSIGQNIGSIANHPNFFPIAVWVQRPSNAAAYNSIGINMFVGIWGGLDQVKLDYLKYES